MMSEVVFAIKKPHLIDAIDESAKPNDEFTAGEWCAQAKVRSETER